MPDRGYNLEFEQRSDYLVARVSGPTDSVTIKLRYFAEVAAETRRRGLHKLLVIEALEATLPMSEVHSASIQVAKVVKGVIIAFFDEREQDYDNNRLGEAIAVNNGAVGRVFRTRDDAEKWIAAVP